MVPVWLMSCVCVQGERKSCQTHMYNLRHTERTDKDALTCAFNRHIYSIICIYVVYKYIVYVYNISIYVCLIYKIYNM